MRNKRHNTVRLVVAVVALGSGSLVLAAPASAAEVTCEGQTATIVATADHQTLDGTDGPDVISTAGHSGIVVHAGGGDDTVCSTEDTDSVSGENIVLGEGGDDVLDIQSHATDVWPGPGDDTLHVPPLGDAHEPEVTVRFDPAVAGLTIDVPAGTVDGEGHDEFTGTPFFVGTSGGPDTFNGGPGRDFFSSTQYPVPYDGDQPADVIHGYGGDDVFYGFQAEIFAGPGDDRVYGFDNDVRGGAGRDRIAGSQGGHLDGGAGADTIGSAFDLDEPPDIGIDDFRIDGGRGDDRLFLTSAYDGGYFACSSCGSTLDGGPGSDIIDLRHTAGHIRLNLAFANAHYQDTVIHIGHFEDVQGSEEADVLIGNAKANHLDGGGGADRLVGRAGPDVLVGGQGHDVANGGVGRDRCVAEVRRAC